MSHPNGPPPFFSAAWGSSGKKSKTKKSSVAPVAVVNLDAILEECVFTPDGNAVFLSEDADVLNSGEGDQVAVVASKPLRGAAGAFAPVAPAGGVYTTQLDEHDKPALTMGALTAEAAARVKAVPFKEKPQKRNQLEYAVSKAKKESDKKLRNKEHAKKSRLRKMFLLESLQQSVAILKAENEMLKDSIRSHLGDTKATELLHGGGGGDGDADGLLASSQGIANKVLDDPDFSFIKALQTAQQNFVVTDPSLPDNPIVYASQGFLNLTGYSLDQILGRNCRFLQGPETDPRHVERIRKAIEQGNDMSVCLLNYRVDGTTFWNQFFIAALRDDAGQVTNFVGVQCKVSDQYAAVVTKQQEDEEADAIA